MKWHKIEEKKPIEDKEYLVVVNRFKYGVLEASFVSTAAWDRDMRRWLSVVDGFFITHWAEITMPEVKNNEI